MGLCMMEVSYNRVYDLVEYYWCSILFRIKCGRTACVRIPVCETRRDVAGIKYRTCFVCVFREMNI